MNESEPVIRSADLSDIKRIMALEEGSIIHPWTSGDIETQIAHILQYIPVIPSVE